MREFNVLIGDGVTLQDKDLFFSGYDNKRRPGEMFLKFPKEIRFPELLSKLKLFKSNSEARKNGWNKDIPNGFSDYTIGKLRSRVTVLKII